MNGLSIVVPTLNEAGNLPELFERIHLTMSKVGIPYEIVIIDDYSDDLTVKTAVSFAGLCPIQVHMKGGVQGKAQSLLEGFTYAKYDTLAFIDADLQYPPEAFADMIEQMRAGYDVVLTRRVVHKVSRLRLLMSRVFSYLFVELLHGLPFDAQSGMKLFRKEVLTEMTLKPTPWTFDLAFLVSARNNGHQITSVDITFQKRAAGKSKVRIIRASLEIMKATIMLRFSRKKPAAICAIENHSRIGAGIAYKRQRFITHTTLNHKASALRTFTLWQKAVLLSLAAGILLGIVMYPFATVLVVVSVITTVYFFDVFFNLYLVRKSLLAPPEISFTADELQGVADDALPVYTILCPLYRESHVLPGFIRAISQLDWPKEKLDVILLLEEDDEDTITAAQRLHMPTWVRTFVVPHSQPKTKPKACNYGLAHARGEFVVIYDAEDIPDAQQLKKAYLAFQRVTSDVRCLQAKLNYFNHNQNLLTRLFTAEYSLWFDVMLVGMQAINTTIPLGGTSNHFRTSDLEALEGWDPFNVTEDCDLGTRLFRSGFKTAVIDSVTLEEANSEVGNWIRQRSRWLKGYMQTYFVHMRYPVQFLRENGWHALAFQFIVGGKVAFILVNPLMWLMTIAYFVAYPWVGATIESLFPTPIFTMAAISLIFGNFLQFYYYMIGCAQRNHWHLVKYVYLLPVYWILTSVAGYVAAYQLVVKPHYWEKTRHGLHVVKPAVEQSL